MCVVMLPRSTAWSPRTTWLYCLFLISEERRSSRIDRELLNALQVAIPRHWWAHSPIQEPVLFPM